MTTMSKVTKQATALELRAIQNSLGLTWELGLNLGQDYLAGRIRVDLERLMNLARRLEAQS